MNHTITLTMEIPPTREILVKLPDNIPVGRADVSVQISSQLEGEAHTLGDFLTSEFFGMWRDREDIVDSVEFAHELRQGAWRRTDCVFSVDPPSSPFPNFP